MRLLTNPQFYTYMTCLLAEADSAGTYDAESVGDVFYNNQFINVIIH